MARRNLAPFALLPDGVMGILKELSRHLLKRPVVGVCVVATSPDGRLLLVRRGDTGTWALPGGTLEWGEELALALPREVAEETGATWLGLDRVSGVYSRPDRDPRFHAVTVCCVGRIDEPIRGPKNTLEIREARLFPPDARPAPLAMGMDDMLRDALANSATVLE